MLETRVVVYGLSDPRQAREAGLLGVDGVIVRVGFGGPGSVDAEGARELSLALPPLVARWAWLAPGVGLPIGYSGAVTALHEDRPAGCGVHVAVVPPEVSDVEQIPHDLDAVWVPPGMVPLDPAWVARLARRFRVMLEVMGGGDAAEAVVRTHRPYAVLLGEGVWFAPGICDMDLMEEAIRGVGRSLR